MTDREKLIELLVNSPGLCTIFGKEEEFAENADWLIANGVTLDNQVSSSKWISVKDRLPEHPGYDWVLVQAKMNPEDYYGVPHIAELRNGTWYDEDDLPLEEFRSVIVTHWMPLPQPPKGE